MLQVPASARTLSANFGKPIGRKQARRHRRKLGDLKGDEPAPRLDYVNRMRQQHNFPGSCPLLMLAPMENLADRPFRRAIATIGGFDESCTEFIRIPSHAQRPGNAIKGITAPYSAWELAEHDTPLGAQIMGSNPGLLNLAAHHLAHVKEAPRVDLNCGCPANCVTGGGAGSSLLRTPELLHECVKAMVEGAGGKTIVTVKLRSGFDDTSLFEENLLAAQEAGAAFVTIHPRTRKQKYDGRAAWPLIARARQILQIPVVGNGDVVSVQRAHELLRETNCSAIMVGRGAVQDPLLFHRIRMSFAHPELPWEFDEPEAVCAFLRAYAWQAFGIGGDSHSSDSNRDGKASNNGGSSSSSTTEGTTEDMVHASTSKHLATERGKFGCLKKVLRYLFRGNPRLAENCERLLRLNPSDGISLEELLEASCQVIMVHWVGEPQGAQLHLQEPSIARLVGHRN